MHAYTYMYVCEPKILYISQYTRVLQARIHPLSSGSKNDKSFVDDVKLVRLKTASIHVGSYMSIWYIFYLCFF